MLKSFRKIFAPPIFEDEEKARAARYLNAIINTSLILLIVFLISGQYALIINIVFALIALSLLGMYFLIRSGKVAFTAILLISIFWISLTYLAWVGEGVRDVGIMIYIILIFLASLLGNTRISIGLTGLSILSAGALFYAEKTGYLVPVKDSLIANTFSISAVFVLIQVIIYFTVTDLEKSLFALKENEKSLLTQNKELLQLQDNLQKHTSELEKISKKTQRQAARLRTITEVSQAISLTQNLETLLPEITKKISAGFNFYHVGIFSIDDDKKIASLEAANSVAGKKMLAREYQIEVKRHNFIARAIKNIQPQVAHELDENHPDYEISLPETRSKIALPLKVANDIIGALDIQTTRDIIFSEEEVDIFLSLANQVAIAIENARQSDITQVTLAEAHAVSRQYIHQSWEQLGAVQRQQSYHYENKTARTLSENKAESPVKSAQTISIPVQVHKEIIGYIDITKDTPIEKISADEKELVQAIANRAALALENARLLEETTRRAGRERLVSQITTKIRSTNDPQDMIETALEELKNVLGASKVELTTKS
ncbi:MAG: GAF domain-containing protein [Anaerolineae bacterium]|jgi:GAF domain-containing protein|nr:GAF domain-containing protein [Anaerolineae bacterium]